VRMGGVTEVAEILGVSRQRVAMLRRRPDFPDSIAEIAQGPIFNLDEVEGWAGVGVPPPNRPPIGCGFSTHPGGSVRPRRTTHWARRIRRRLPRH
jgi:hypothetical protein